MSCSVKREHYDVSEVSRTQTLPDVAMSVIKKVTSLNAFIFISQKNGNTGNNAGIRDCLRSQKLNVT